LNTRERNIPFSQKIVSRIGKIIMWLQGPYFIWQLPFVTCAHSIARVVGRSD
jgi:hypothetical protein